MTAAHQPSRHEALLYAGEDEFVRAGARFVRDGLAAGEPVMVAVVPQKIRLLREALGAEADDVVFTDIEEVGRNPARIIPAWRAFIAERAVGGAPVRGIGEPIWPGRPALEVAEAQLHEALVNVVLQESSPAHLVCPYDVSRLGADVVHEARCSHPEVIEAGLRAPSPHFRAGPAGLEPFDTPLAPPPRTAQTVSFDRASLREARRGAREAAEQAGLPAMTVDGFELAVHEIATNSVIHGGGLGVLRLWIEEGRLVAEIRDRGRLADPLVGRHPPTTVSSGGWGVYLANQVCDLVQIRSGPDGTVVRLSMCS